MNYPKLTPIPIKTKGKPWYIKLKIWLAATRKWEVIEDYSLYIPYLKQVLLIPKGFVFDGASVPKPLWPILSPTGILFLPALFHDYAYKNHCYLNLIKQEVYQNKGRKFYDTVFCKMAVEINDMPILDKVAKLALRMFGWLHY